MSLKSAAPAEKGNVNAYFCQCSAEKKGGNKQGQMEI
jgi:hypothetical protein